MRSIRTSAWRFFALAAVLSTPVAPPQTHTWRATTLTAIEGAAFDRAFAAQMIQDNLDAAEERAGRARLRGDDGRAWTSPPLDAAQFAAYEAVLRSGASAEQDWLLSASGKEAVQIGEPQASSGENPSPGEVRSIR